MIENDDSVHCWYGIPHSGTSCLQGMQTLANKVRVQLLITCNSGTCDEWQLWPHFLATQSIFNSSQNDKGQKGEGKGGQPKAKKRKAKHVKLIYTFEAGGLLTGSPKGEGGLRSAGAVEGGAVGLATAAEAAPAAAAAARARCVSNDAGVLPWTRSGPRQQQGARVGERQGQQASE